MASLPHILSRALHIINTPQLHTARSERLEAIHRIEIQIEQQTDEQQWNIVLQMANALINEPIEAIREKCIQIIGKFFQKTHEKNAQMQLTMVQNLCTQYEKETAEELREALIEIINRSRNDLFEKKHQENAEKNTNQRMQVNRVYARALEDAYPALKKRAALGVVHFKLDDEEIYKALAKNLKHQQSAVRMAALNAMTVQKKLAPVEQLLTDRTMKVREQLSLYLKMFLQYNPGNESALLLLVLCCGDEVDRIALNSYATLEALAAGVAATEQALIADTITSPFDPVLLRATRPFEQKSTKALKKLLAKHRDELVPPILVKLADWNAGQRLIGARALRALIIFLEHEATPSCRHILNAVVKYIRHEDPAVATIISDVAQLVGFFVDRSVWSDILLEGANRSDHVIFASTLAVLSQTLCLLPSIDVSAILRFLDYESCCNDSLPLDAASQSTIEEQNVYQTAILLDENIYDMMFSAALSEIDQRLDAGGEIDFTLNVFFKLVHRSQTAIVECFDEVLSLLIRFSNNDCKPEHRIQALTSVYEIGQLSAAQYLNIDHIKNLLSLVVAPSLAWRPGSLAAALRLQSVTVLNVWLSNSLVPSLVLTELSHILFPSLISNLDEDDPASRAATMAVFNRIFMQLPSHTDDDETTKLYQSLMKRFDDSDDQIRIQAFQTLAVFVKRIMPPAACYDCSNTHFTALLRSALIHLGDSSIDIQNTVYQFLKSVAMYNPPIFRQEIDSAITKDAGARSNSYIIQLHDLII